MKRRLFLFSILASLALTGCDALDAFFDDTPSVPDDSKKEPAEPTDDKDVPATLKSISVEGTLTKTQYYVDQDWSSEGLSVKGVYSNNDEKTLDSKDYQFTFSPSKPALDVTEISVIAKLANGDLTSEEKKYSVEVFERIPVDKEITSIVIEETLTKTEYKENDNWDPTGLKVRAYYNDSTSSYLSNEDYIFIYNPTKAFKNTTSVSIKAKLNNSNIESATRNFVVSVQEAVEYTISYNSNGGSGTMEPTVGEDPAVASCTFIAPSNKKFDHWNTSSSDTGTTYNVGAKPKANVSLYAIWVDDTSGDDTYYSECAGLSGSALQSKLKSINAPENPSYDWPRYEDADEALDDSTCILSIYTRHNIKKENHVGSSYAWDKWNREHVWTQTSYPASKTDNHNIFACEGQINGYRSDKPFAEGGDTVVVFGHTTGCKQTGSTFEPCDEAKGEIARSVMYGTVQYSYTMTEEIDSIYLALKWHLEHPITERDIRRNEIVYGNQGNRNPFVDHPEYACKIWGSTNAQTKAICGM